MTPTANPDRLMEEFYDLLNQVRHSARVAEDAERRAAAGDYAEALLDLAVVEKAAERAACHARWAIEKARLLGGGAS